MVKLKIVLPDVLPKWAFRRHGLLDAGIPQTCLAEWAPQAQHRILRTFRTPSTNIS